MYVFMNICVYVCTYVPTRMYTCVCVYVCIVVTRTRGSWVPSPSVGNWHGRVGFVDEELKLTTTFSVVLMSNFNVLVIGDEYYNKINIRKWWKQEMPMNF